MTYSEKELKAMKKALVTVGLEGTNENVKHYEACDYLSINKGRNGRYYAWYIDADKKETAIDIETLEELPKNKIEEQFA
jgi:hypothetical protein